MILILNYLFIASSTLEDEAELRRVITRGEKQWEAGFVPGSFNHMQVKGWWMKARNLLTEAGCLRAFSVEDLKAHLGYMLFILGEVSLQSSCSGFMLWRRQNPSKRPFGSRASIALICYSFSGITNISDYQSVDPWLFDMGFVNDMLRRLQKSPLFDDNIRLDELKIVLTNLEAILSMEDERSALIQPHPIDINDTIQIQAYFATAFRALEPSILLQILPKWRKVWIRSRKNSKDDLPRLVMEPMTYDMRVQHIANIFQEVSSLNALGQETKQVKLLERSKPDRMILAEIQSYLLGFKGEAEVAVEKAAEWVNETMRVELCSSEI
ncbi:unnamed protein product [Penicillium roqueforti FM164]|uniref:Genomic scaffold, ProqFM164S02 n=1 Tax=Penicillium roqueforti (strain FM164) TaxID=1365484 RepID=W6QSJ1_PENRF|nr:unnamed protein product [Penicillium roqueforti FM164]